MRRHTIKFFSPSFQKNEKILRNAIFPKQTHSCNIIRIKTGTETLHNCDGLITANENNFVLGIKTADCAAICFFDHKNYGIIHAGWRGLTNGIIEKMLNNFIKPKIFVSPILNQFEIKKDNCYQIIKNKFGKKYFSIKKINNQKIIIFKFQLAIKSILPPSAIYDPRDTAKDKNLASWRRDKTEQRNYTIIY